MVKNPYSLVEKANNTFNLYLEKYDDIESYMDSSKNEQNEIKELINSFFNEYKIQQNKLNSNQFKFLEFIEVLIEENATNKKLIKNLELKINNLTNIHDINNKSMIGLIENSNNELYDKIRLDVSTDSNKQINETQKINHNLNFIKNDINNKFNEIKTENQNIITTETNKQLNETQKINEHLNDINNNLSNKINDIKTETIDETQKIDDYIKNIQYNLTQKSNSQINETRKINENINQLKKDVDNKITQISEENQNIITTETNKQLNEIQNIITTETNKQLNEIQKINENQNIITTETNKQLNENINRFKNDINNRLNEIKTENQNIITTETNKQLNEIQKINENQNIITTETNKQLNEIQKINENQEKLNQKYQQNQEITRETNKQLNENINRFKNDINNRLNEIKTENQILKSLLDSQVDANNNLNNAVKLFTQNYEECKRYFFNDNESLLKEHLDTDELFRLCYFNNIQFLSYSPTENRILLKTKDGIILGTNNRFYTIKEVIGFDGYSVPQLYQFNDFVVFDIGMNRAYASLRFAEFKNCSAVYGFEIDVDTYNKAIYNIDLNPKLSEKITPYNIGLSNEDKNTELYFLEGADGLNTLESEFVNIQYELRDNQDKIQTRTVKVKKASDVLSEIIEKNNITSKIVLKIDTEGSEYNILDDLVESGLIDKIDLILGEGHNFNDRNIANELLELGFNEIENKDNKIVYNFAFVRNEYYNIWPLRE